MTHQPCALGSLRQAAKASVLHTDIRRFESVREHHASLAQRQSAAPTQQRRNVQLVQDAPFPSVAQRQSNRPITGRPRIVTARKDHGPRGLNPNGEGAAF